MKNEITKLTSQVYQWLDEQLPDGQSRCEACGKCCDFTTYDHRLFVTTPEMIHFAANTSSENMKQMLEGTCPYMQDNKCTVYENRFAGCRIFSCKDNAEKQARLSEQALKKFKAICEKYDIPYQYLELKKALNKIITMK